MRPQQHGRRQRNRGGNRRNQNPLSRSYESNGPDVKIRGNAQQVADKYGALARDAQASGDRVMAENYLQHAEHYNRIIMSAQAQMPKDDNNEDRESAQNNDDAGNAETESTKTPAAASADEPQPVLSETPAEVRLEEDQLANGAEKPVKPRRSRRDSRSAGQMDDQGASDQEQAAKPRRTRRSKPVDTAEPASLTAETLDAPQPEVAQDADDDTATAVNA